MRLMLVRLLVIVIPGPKRGEACLIRSLFVEVEDPIAACEAPHIHLG